MFKISKHSDHVWFHAREVGYLEVILRHENKAAIVTRNFQLPLCPQDAVQREGLRASSFCPVTMANAVNGTTTPTSQLQFAPSFRSVPKGSLGPRSRPTGQIIGRRGGGGGEGKSGPKIEEAYKNGSLCLLWAHSTLHHPPPPPPACWVNFEMWHARLGFSDSRPRPLMCGWGTKCRKYFLLQQISALQHEF